MVCHPTTRNHSIPATPLNMLDIHPPQTTGTHCLRSLLLHLRPPQSRGRNNNFIREHVFSCLLHLQRPKAVRLFGAQFRECPALRPVGATAEVVQIADINKGKFTHDYQSAISLLVIDFMFLEGRDGELVLKELAVVDSHSNRVSSYVFKRPYSWEEVPAFNARIKRPCVQLE